MEVASPQAQLRNHPPHYPRSGGVFLWRAWSGRCSKTADARHFAPPGVSPRVRRQLLASRGVKGPPTLARPSACSLAPDPKVLPEPPILPEVSPTIASRT